MNIKVTPEDLVRRCLWDHYVYYVVGSDKEGERILKENKEFEITEKDALVIGLLKTIETENLIHKFNTYIVDLLSNKSINNNQQTLLRKRTLETRRLGCASEISPAGSDWQGRRRRWLQSPVYSSRRRRRRTGFLRFRWSPLEGVRQGLSAASGCRTESRG